MSAGDTGTENPGPAGSDGRAQSTNGKMKKPVSVTELELQFAQNPESTAYVDLCEAYFDQGRFMEAMVVCKKGIKAHPSSVDAKILLSKVYSRQKKYKRALSELDELVAQNDKDPTVYLARGRVRDESGDEQGAVADLKKSIDSDRGLTEAVELLKAKNIVYPPPASRPPPVPEPSAPGLPVRPHSQVSVTPVRPGQEPDTADLSSNDIVRRSPQPPPMPPAVRAASFARVDPGIQYAPMKLEGEEELEALARKVAEEKPDRGRPKTTFMLMIALAVIGLVTIVSVLYNKRKVEAIDELTTRSFKAFNRDTYGAYKEAAEDMREILGEWDSKHALTAGRLAETYVLLWSEHGESDLEPKLKEMLERAKKVAPEVSYTIAADALYTLYSGSDRQAAAKAAYEQLNPIVSRLEDQGGGGTHAELALGIIELQLGDYDEATRRLSSVSQVLPGSVLAKVWHARAAFRAKRLASALNSYEAALRAEPNHPSALAGLALVHLELGGLGSAGDDLIKFDEFAQRHQKEISRRDAALAEFARSELFRYAGEEQKAAGAYENALRLDPKNADFPYGLGRWLVKNGRHKEALKPLRKAVEMEPTRWTFLVDLAEAEMWQKDFSSAEKHVEEALRRAPDRSETLLAKAALLRRREDPKAEAYIKGLLTAKPTAKVLINVELARLYRQQDRLPEARDLFEKEIIPNFGGYAQLEQADILISYGILMEKLGERTTAANSYDQAAQYGSIEGSYRLATLLIHDDKVKAKAACNRVLGAGTSRWYDQAVQLCASLK